MVYALLLSIAADLTCVTEDTRIFVGGYNLEAHIAVLMIGIVGTMASIGGLIGLHEGRISAINTFSIFMFCRAAAVAIIMWLDEQILVQCERYSFTGDLVTSSSGTYNQAIATVALDGLCKPTRAYHFVLAIVDILVTLWGAASSYRWAYVSECTLAYHIAFTESTYPMDTSTRAGYGGVASDCMISGESELDYGARHTIRL